MNQRRSLSDKTRSELVRLRAEREAAADAFKARVLSALDEGSIRAVMEAANLPMSTIQRWRNEVND